MAVPKIRKLDELLSPCLGKGKTIVRTEITRLTAPGENFGSEMLKVDVFIEAEDENQEEFNIVAKLIPENEFARNVIFNAEVSFNVEKEFYNSIIPTLQAFQISHGLKTFIDCFPRFYGARNNLRSDSDIVDADAVMVLENLKVKGYKNIPRNVGFDLPTAKLILKHLAQFHAVPIALKQKDPETFEKKVKAYMLCMYPPPPRPPIEGFMQLIYMIMREFDTCKHLIPKMQKSAQKYRMARDDLREPFATLSHQDFWINNIMVKFDYETPVACKFLDFQIYNYDSPAADLFFFLFSSIRLDVLKSNLNNLLKYYQQQFQETLKSLNCDLNFSYEKLLEEIASTTEWELAHTVFLYMVVINSPEGGIPLPNDKKKSIKSSQVQIAESTKERIRWLCEECEKRGWLNF